MNKKQKTKTLDICVCRFCMIFVKLEDRNDHRTYHKIIYCDKDMDKIFAYHPSARDWLPEYHAGWLWIDDKSKYGFGSKNWSSEPDHKVEKSLEHYGGKT